MGERAERVARANKEMLRLLDFYNCGVEGGNCRTPA